MKKNVLLLFALLAISTTLTFSQITVIDDFENGPGHFTQQITFSGSTVGVKGSVLPPTVDSTTAAFGEKSLKIEIYDDETSSVDWQVRMLSGGGEPSGNVLLDSIGYIGYWLKTNVDFLSAGIILDAPGTPAILGSERSNLLPVIGDGQWHLYQWDLADSNQWNAWAGAGTNGIIENPVTIDAIWFAAPDSLANSDTAIVWFDYLTYNPTGEVPVELVSFAATVNQNIVDLKWITATETNNKGFEVERKSANGSFEKIAFVDGKGTSTDISAYVYSDAVEKAGKYTYRLKQVDFDGTFTYSNAVEVEIIAAPGEYALAQNYPNPFNPATTITFNMPEAGMANLAVYNLLGEKVAELVNEVKESGFHTVNFDASNLASGTYIYTLNVNGNAISKKMVLMK